MTRAEFRRLLKEYDQFTQNTWQMYEIGVDLHEGKYPTALYTEKFFDYIIQYTYNNFGVDWINWFIYENDFGRAKMEAYSGDTLICQTVNSLYDYVEQYRKSNITTETTSGEYTRESNCGCGDPLLEKDKHQCCGGH